MKLGIYLYTSPFGGKYKHYILVTNEDNYGYNYIDLTTKNKGWFHLRSLVAHNLKLIHECDPDKAKNLYPEYFI